MSAFPMRSWAMSMAVYSPFSGGLSGPKNYSTYPILTEGQADIEDDIKDRADQRRLSNASLDCYEHISKGINGITDISDKDDAESVCEISLFNGHEATLHGLLTKGILQEFLQSLMVIRHWTKWPGRYR